MSNRLEEKIIDLETSLGLLQRDFEKQNEVLIANTRVLQQMELSIKRLFDQVTNLHANTDNSRTLEDEKPPHY
ncbi:MAG: SlyX family protein [Planctomycetaceae bacterium]|nr:SlyX family protein [Planctomycetaceae bacterium]MCP4465067.1 SlyX family protein [Planctomycetaceae bacterium]MDG1808798.1 SlyX family protein [Pirellulaceae bacterium]MDG2102854.1 SlyX family protein [Pirellulaceae bacterium]